MQLNLKKLDEKAVLPVINTDGNSFNLTCTAIATGAGHHSLVKVPGRDEWYIAYHRRPKGDTSPNHRETCIEKVEFDNQGFIRRVKITREGVKAVSIK